jgi:hypothetical protein
MDEWHNFNHISNFLAGYLRMKSAAASTMLRRMGFGAPDQSAKMGVSATCGLLSLVCVCICVFGKGLRMFEIFC